MNTNHAEATVPTDAELDRIAALGNPWPLLTACESRLAEDPDSEHARLYRGAALVGLGVGELAVESIEGLCDENAETLRSAITGTAPSAIAPEQLISVCRRNTLAAGASFLPLAEAFSSWKITIRSGERRFFQCNDGNVLVSANGVIQCTRDEMGESKRADLAFIPPGEISNVNAMPGVLVVHWTRSPWLLSRMLKIAGRGQQGYTPRIFVGALDGPENLLDGLAMTPIAVRLRSAPVIWYAGPDAIAELGTELRSLWRWALHRRIITIDENSDNAAALQAALDAALAEQARRFDSLTAETRKLGKDRTRDYWQRRFTNTTGKPEPLRVLIPCTRYTTYVQHAAEDLASAIRRAGDEARVLLEPDPDLRPAATFELEAHSSFDPDLTIVPNWPRASRPNAWPPTAPAVCWVQDMLGGLLDPRLGAAQGSLDFTAGVLNGSLFRDFGYPLERSVFLTTPVCPVKFHDAPPSTGSDRVDVAYISHQSEPPEAMAKRLARSAATKREREIIDALSNELFAAPVQSGRAHQDIEAMVRGVLGDSADGSAVSRLALMAALPLAERQHRHTMLNWAARICDRHGLSLGLYGSGWEQTSLAEHARGPLKHNETLRSNYASAGCHLHASLATNAHQRVFECALSGGLMLRRGPSPDIPALAMGSQLLLWAETPARTEDGYHVYRVHHSESPLTPDAHQFDPIRYARVMREAPAPFIEYHDQAIREQWLDPTLMKSTSAWLPRIPLEQFPDWSFDNASETLFDSEESLEAAILRAVRDTEWRALTIQSHRTCALAYNTTDAFWSSLRHAITNSLSEG